MKYQHLSSPYSMLSLPYIRFRVREFFQSRKYYDDIDNDDDDDDGDDDNILLLWMHLESWQSTREAFEWHKA